MRNRNSSQASRVSDFKMHGVRNSQNGRIAVLGFTINGQLALPTRSFWQWLFAQFSEAVPSSRAVDRKSTIDEAEFFHRLRTLQPTAEVLYELYWDDDGNAVLHAPRPTASELCQLRQDRYAHFDGQDDDAYFMFASPGTHRFSVN